MKNNKKGITLISLVVTIIILLILAGITISQIKQNGLLAKAELAKIEAKKAEYKDEVTMMMMEAQIEKTSNKEKIIFELIDKRIKEKEWYLSNEIYGTDEMIITNTDLLKNIKNIQLIVKTKDNYEIAIKIQEDNSYLEYVIYGEAETFTITYKYNDGSKEQTTQKVRKGKKTLLIGKPCERDNYTFTGWTREANSDTIYYENAVYPENGINEDITLYAKWTRDTVKITFAKNDGSGVTTQNDVASNSETTIPTNMYTRTDYNFLGWSTSANATTATYENCGKINVGNEDITLYAVWQKIIYYKWKRYSYTPKYIYKLVENWNMWNYYKAPSINWKPKEQSCTITVWSGFEFSEDKGYYGTGTSKEIVFPKDLTKTEFDSIKEELKAKMDSGELYYVRPEYPFSDFTSGCGWSGSFLTSAGMYFIGMPYNEKLTPAEKVDNGADKIEYIDTIETTEKDKYTDGYVDGTYYYEYDGQR